MKRALSVLLVAIMVITSITVATAASKTSLTAKKITVFYKNAGGSWWASSRNSKRTEYYANIQYEGNGSFTTNVRVEHNSKTLKKNKDYTIGKISTIKGINTVKSVKIKGKGNYKDTITLYYGIAPSHPQIVLDTVKQKNSTTIEIKANIFLIMIINQQHSISMKTVKYVIQQQKTFLTAQTRIELQ